MTEVWEGDPTPHRGTRHLSGRPLTSQADPTPYKEDPSPHRGTRHLSGDPSPHRETQHLTGVPTPHREDLPAYKETQHLWLRG